MTTHHPRRRFAPPTAPTSTTNATTALLVDEPAELSHAPTRRFAPPPELPATALGRALARVPRVSVVIPTLNEERNVVHVLGLLPEGLHEVILVDGRSTDGTVEAARTALPSIRVVDQPGKGKGDALQAGFMAVTGDIVVTLDADGSADPGEIPAFVDSLCDGADFAKGSRFMDTGGSADITRLRRLGNWGLVKLVNALYRTHYSDLCYGYNAFWADRLPYDTFDAPGFEVETAVNVRVARAGLEVAEVPSYEYERLHGSSNLRTFRDGFRVLRSIIRESALNPWTWRRPVGWRRVAPQPAENG
jgi:glycosyltransferase involved in cell wall biosynthesis